MGERPNQLLQHLLENLDVAPPAVLRAELARADHIDGHKHLRKLITRDDVPADVAAQYVRPTTVDSYATRADAESRLLKPHGLRAKAIVNALAANPNPDPEVVAAALARLDEREPPVTIADALRGREPTWFTPAQAFKLVHPASNCIRVRKDHRALLARLGPDKAADLLRVTQARWVIQELATFDLPAGAFAFPLRWRYPGGYTREIRSVIWRLLERSTDREALTQRLMASQPHDVSEAICAESLAFDATTPVVPHTPWDLTPAAPPAPAGLSPVRTAPLTQAAKSSDPATLTETTDRFLAMGVGPGVQALLANPALPRADRHRILEALSSGALSTAGDPHSGFDGVVAFDDDYYAVSLWAQTYPGRTLRRHGWEPLGGRASAPQILRAWVADRPSDLPGRLDAAIDAGIRPRELQEFPCEHLWTLLPRRASSGIALEAEYALGAALTKVLADTLEDSPERWAAYHALGENFPGTLRELMDVCTAVAE